MTFEHSNAATFIPAAPGWTALEPVYNEVGRYTHHNTLPVIAWAITTYTRFDQTHMVEVSPVTVCGGYELHDVWMAWKCENSPIVYASGFDQYEFASVEAWVTWIRGYPQPSHNATAEESSRAGE
jgi:hypothetical protein